MVKGSEVKPYQNFTCDNMKKLDLKDIHRIVSVRYETIDVSAITNI